MRIIEPYVEVEVIDFLNLSKKLERIGRVAYKSEESISPNSYEKFLQRIIRSGHESVIEHHSITTKFVVDRGISHELVRHRLSSFTQESTRYCNYSLGKFGGSITLIKPFFFEEGSLGYEKWLNACKSLETAYLGLLDAGHTAQEARSVLPNSLKTEIVITTNPRDWRHFFKLRADKAAHPQMQQVAIPLLKHFQSKAPILFGDVGYNTNFKQENYAEVREMEELK